MPKTLESNDGLQHYSVWDRTTRLFHWINVVCILGLIAIGVALLNGDALGFSGDGKILLKTVHVYIGYVFAANLIWRIVWGFIGNKFARFSTLRPNASAIREYIDGSKAGNPPQYIGHNPVAKLMVIFLFALLTTQAVTGLVLAGTDLYKAPFGGAIAEWVAKPGELANLQPGSKEFVDPEAYKEMRAFRKPFVVTHEYAFYLLLAAIFLHIAAVVVTEVREKNGLISAMFTGQKVADKKPVDLE